MDNQYTFIQEDMQRLTAIVRIDNERRVPEQVMNLLESLLAKPVSQPVHQFQRGDKVRIINDSTYFSVGEVVYIDFADGEDTELPLCIDGFWISADDVELVQEGGVEA